MRYLLLLVFAGGVGACAFTPTRVKRIHYKGLNIRAAVASPDAVDAHCRKYVKRNDKGEPITRRIRCCTIRRGGAPFIWMARGEEDCLAHELCHAEGRPADECANVHPERG